MKTVDLIFGRTALKGWGHSETRGTISFLIVAIKIQEVKAAITVDQQEAFTLSFSIDRRTAEQNKSSFLTCVEPFQPQAEAALSHDWELSIALVKQWISLSLAPLGSRTSVLDNKETRERIHIMKASKKRPAQLHWENLYTTTKRLVPSHRGILSHHAAPMLYPCNCCISMQFWEGLRCCCSFIEYDLLYRTQFCTKRHGFMHGNTAESQGTVYVQKGCGGMVNVWQICVIWSVRNGRGHEISIYRQERNSVMLILTLSPSKSKSKKMHQTPLMHSVNGSREYSQHTHGAWRSKRIPQLRVIRLYSTVYMSVCMSVCKWIPKPFHTPILSLIWPSRGGNSTLSNGHSAHSFPLQWVWVEAANGASQRYGQTTCSWGPITPLYNTLLISAFTRKTHPALANVSEKWCLENTLKNSNHAMFIQLLPICPEEHRDHLLLDYWGFCHSWK